MYKYIYIYIYIYLFNTISIYSSRCTDDLMNVSNSRPTDEKQVAKIKKHKVSCVRIKT